ncbi:unnamed protein product [Mesocestoides corti]|uniref:Uncharacterized protein n=1 Tax=Mesocestoides corti TaxID=53468 RepID=A0A0R3URD5_MESCO|nr:unnamed protein product [Mesocestoides corti]
MEDKNEAGGVGWAVAAVEERVEVAASSPQADENSEVHYLLGRMLGTYYDDEIYASVDMRTLFRRIAESVCANIVCLVEGLTSLLVVQDTPVSRLPNLRQFVQSREVEDWNGSQMTTVSDAFVKVFAPPTNNSSQSGPAANDEIYLAEFPPPDTKSNVYWRNPGPIIRSYRETDTAMYFSVQTKTRDKDTSRVICPQIEAVFGSVCPSVGGVRFARSGEEASCVVDVRPAHNQSNAQPPLSPTPLNINAGLCALAWNRPSLSPHNNQLTLRRSPEDKLSTMTQQKSPLNTSHSCQNSRFNTEMVRQNHPSLYLDGTKLVCAQNVRGVQQSGGVELDAAFTTAVVFLEAVNRLEATNS